MGTTYLTQLMMKCQPYCKQATRMTPEDFLTVKGTDTSYKPCKL